mmetsp:Transcript_36455/g.123402  ORF Transcript_36455/g.123402 Transcript_36455/m.123402 type:complete len:239 (+) Transcript_36455:499-1215(+)
MVRRRFTRSVSVRSWMGPPTAGVAAVGSAPSSSSSSSSSSLPDSSSPRISRLMSAQAASWASKSSSTRKTSSRSSLSILSSSDSSNVIWSSRSTRSSSSGTAGYSRKPVFRSANKPSMVYWTRLSMAPSCKMPRNRSKTASSPAGDTWSKSWPTSFVKFTAISTESSVGSSKSTVSSWSATSSWAIWWFTRWPRNFANAVATTLSRRLYARRKPTTTRFSNNSPFSGSFVFSTAASAA